MTDSSPATRPGLPDGEARLDAEALRMLLDVVRRLHVEREPDGLLAAVVDSLVSLVKADRGFLLLKEPSGLRFAIARDRAGAAVELAKFRVSESVLKEVAESGVTRLIDDASSAGAYQARLSIVALNLRTILCTALKGPHGVLGVIYVDSSALTRRFTAKDVPLVEAFATQAAVALERVRLEQAERERDLWRRQVETAAEIQRTFLPGEFPDGLPLRGAVASIPALLVGGDFYDVIRFPDGRTGLLVGDVAGKGVPAALFGARLLSDVRSEALLRDDVAATLSAVNDLVARRSTRGMFVTLLYAVHDPARGELEYANAGHLAPIVRRSAGGLDRWEEGRSLPLGVVAGTTYESARRPLRAGETWLALTDGVLDAMGPSGERFGEERLDAFVASGPARPSDVVTGLCRAVAEFTAHVPQADDVTCLAVTPA